MKREWTKAQQLAMQPLGTTVLVSAAAGSGKTATLTERIIRRLTDPDHPAKLSRMLIITFTRAATAELKQRISDALAKAIADDPTNRHLQQQYIGLGGAHISTIDSFFYEPVKTHFAECGFPASFRIADDAEILPLCERIMEGLVDEYYVKYAERIDDNVFSMLQNNPFADLCDALSEAKHDQDLISTLIWLYNKLLTYPVGLARLSNEAAALRREAEGDFFTSTHGAVFAEWAEEFLASYIPFFQTACEIISADPLATKTDGTSFNYDLDFLRRLQVLLYNKSYPEFQTLALSYAPVRLGKKTGLDPQFMEYREARDAFKLQIKALQKHVADDAETIAAQMRGTALMCEVLYDLLSTYDVRINEEKRARGISTFDDNRRNLLRLLLDEEGHPTPLAEEYLRNFDEVYIDEYQDVDEMQDTIFSLIGGNHRFMVGDIKQSIYVFRGADPSVFARYRRACDLLDPEIHLEHPEQRPTVYETGAGIFMSNNFRCDESVIRVTNAICGHIFAACPDSIAYTKDDDLVFSKKPPSEDYKPPRVEVAILRKSDGKAEDADDDVDDLSSVEKEAMFVANRIAELLRSGARLADGSPIAPKDIAILARKRKHFGTFMAAMAAMGIPTGCEELEKQQIGKDVLHGADMMFLLNLLRVIDNPDNDIPLSEVLRAPFPGLTCDDLLTLREQDADTHSLYASLEACADRRIGNAVLQDKAIAFREWLEHYRHLSTTLPADALLRQLGRDGRCACRTSKAFRMLYDNARTGHSSSFTGLYTFLRYFEKKLLTTNNGNADEGGQTDRVTLMTIHNSKGLEFPVCFVVRCGQRFSAKSIEGDLLFSKQTGLSMKLFDRARHAKTNTALRRATALAITRTEREEEMRLLYVAMTRARERLYLVGSTTSSHTATFARGDRYATLHHASYLPWITAGLIARPDVADFLHLIDCTTADITQDPPLEPYMFVQPKSEAVADENATRYRRVLDAFTPPTPLEEALRRVPTKVPASRLTEHLLDECVIYQSDRPVGDEDKLPASEQGAVGIDPRTVESIRASVKLMASGASKDEFELLLRANARPTAAEKGTAVHMFLQYCDYGRIMKNGLDEEIARLCEEGFINDRVVQILDRKQLRSFFESTFFAHVTEATTVERELRFARFVPLKTLTENIELAAALEDRTLYVQGSVDLLCIFPDGHIELCDYKTDRLTKEEREDITLLTAHMQEKHGHQLMQYAAAIEEMYHVRPSKVYIYSVPLGEAVEIKI